MAEEFSVPKTLDINAVQGECQETALAQDHHLSCDPIFRLIANKSILVVIPAFNEERFIGSVVHKARRYTDTVLVIDDGSQDGTALIASEAGATVVRHNTNRGKGCALDTAFSHARSDPPDVLVLMDADGQHMPEELVSVVYPVLFDGVDIAVGSRYLNRSNSVPINRIWGHRLLNFICNSLSGVHVTDSQSGYRAFSPRAIDRISFHSSGFCVESEMQFVARENNLSYQEVPIQIRYLDPPKRSAVKQGFQVLEGIIHLTGQYRPLLFFGLLGTFFVILSIVFGFEVVLIYKQEQSISVVCACVCALTLVIGIISLYTGFTLHSIRGLLINMLKAKDNQLIFFQKDRS